MVVLCSSKRLRDEETNRAGLAASETMLFRLSRHASMVAWTKLLGSGMVCLFEFGQVWVWILLVADQRYGLELGPINLLTWFGLPRGVSVVR